MLSRMRKQAKTKTGFSSKKESNTKDLIECLHVPYQWWWRIGQKCIGVCFLRFKKQRVGINKRSYKKLLIQIY